MTPDFFTLPAGLRNRLEQYHDKQKELLVCFLKAGGGQPGIPWPLTVDQGLCSVWLEGGRKSFRVMGGRREQTRLSRLQALIRCSAGGRKTHAFPEPAA